jgi:luciferase family oxidoreductase group 1
MIPFSVLDLVPVRLGDTPAQALRNTLDLARHCERWGFRRYWMAEHHNMTGIASAATSVVIGYVAGGTSTIRVGAGGIMLPNHSPLVIAEQFGTLESLYPGRIDLGLGRAPGTDQATLRALRRDYSSAEAFPNDVLELQAFLGPVQPGQRIRAVPGAGLNVPLWILGSSLYGAQVAAHYGLPYAFASHFAPGQMMDAIAIYRERFQPSARLARPYVTLGFNVFAADTEAQAHRVATSAQQAFVNLRSGRPGRLPPPREGYLQQVGLQEQAMLRQLLSCAAIGTLEQVREQMQAFIEATGADELMVAGQIYDHQARLDSYAIAAEAGRSLEAVPA